jgi:hypothetical protein
VRVQRGPATVSGHAAATATGATWEGAADNGRKPGNLLCRGPTHTSGKEVDGIRLAFLLAPEEET